MNKNAIYCLWYYNQLIYLHYELDIDNMIYKHNKWNDTTKIKLKIDIKNKNTEKLSLRKW